MRDGRLFEELAAPAGVLLSLPGLAHSTLRSLSTYQPAWSRHGTRTESPCSILILSLNLPTKASTKKSDEKFSKPEPWHGRPGRRLGIQYAGQSFRLSVPANWSGLFGGALHQGCASRVRDLWGSKPGGPGVLIVLRNSTIFDTSPATVSNSYPTRWAAETPVALGLTIVNFGGINGALSSPLTPKPLSQQRHSLLPSPPPWGYQLGRSDTAQSGARKCWKEKSRAELDRSIRLAGQLHWSWS